MSTNTINRPDNYSLTDDDINKLYANSKTPEILKIKKMVAESLYVDRQKILVSQPFIGSMLMRLNIIPVRDARLRTASTDYKNIYFDIEFYSKLTPDERKFVLAHELWHVIYMHSIRMQKRINSLWNEAADCEINYMLKNEKFNPPNGLCFPPKEVEGKNAEEIYDFLYKNSNKKRSKSGSSSSDDQGDESDESNSDNGDLNGQFDKHITEENSNNNGNNEPFGKNGKTGITDKWGDVGFDSDYDPKIPSDAANKIREMISGAVQHAQRTQGYIPQGLEKYLEDILKPELSWKELLSQFITRHVKSETHWGPFNRRHIHKRLYLPSKSGESVNVAVIVDTSGSCYGDLPKFFGEFMGLINQFQGSEITMIQCDAEVHKIETFTDENPFVFDSDSFEVLGFGGSDFIPAFEKIEEENLDIDCIVCLTDGCITFPSKPASVPTLVIVTNDGNENCCDWATVVKFDSNENS